MTELRDPPYPADTLARGWRFEVDMEKVKRSDTWKLAKTGPLRGALLLLWAEAWGESPCGTLPNDDQLVALTIDMPIATFTKHRAVLMRGWWLATDGRLYHETITERVLAMLDKRATDAQRAANYRARKAGGTGDPPGVTGASRVTHAEQTADSTVSSTPSTKHQAPSTPSLRSGVQGACALLPGIPEALVADYLEVRKAKRAGRFTATAVAGLNREAQRAGVSLERALQACCEYSWIGFRADWFEERQARAPRQSANTGEPEWRAEQRQRTQLAAPGIAARGPSNVIELEATDVAPCRLG